MDPHSRPSRSKGWGVWPGWIPPPLPTQIQTEEIAEGLVTGRGLGTVTTRRTGETYTSTWKSGAGVRSRLPSYHMDVPNTMVVRRIRKFFPGKGWFEGTVTSTSAGTGVQGSEREQTFANVQYDDGDFEQQNLPETELYLLQTRQERKSFQKGMGEPVRVNPRWPPATQAAGQHELYPERLETALSHID